MQEQLEHTTQSATNSAIKEPTAELTTPRISQATDEEILTYLRHSSKLAEIAMLAEQDRLVLKACDHFGITVSDEEWQAAGDAFRIEHKLLGSRETLAWFAHQRISVEDWSEGIKIKLLTQKLKEHLFGGSVDGAYLNNRNLYRRVALSQILVLDAATAHAIAGQLRKENASFAALAIAHSKGKQSQENGGFMGVRFLVELMPQIAEAIESAEAGEVLDPVQSAIGYHVLRVEQWFPPELNDLVRNTIMDSMFEAWVQDIRALPE